MLALDPEGRSEVANDLNGELTNFWRVLKDADGFAIMKRSLEATPFSEGEWNRSKRRLLPEEIDVDNAVKFFTDCRQSLAGRMKDFAPISRTRTRRNMNEQASAWLTAIEGLPQVHERLKRVVILNRNAIDVIKQQDGPETCFYIDCPYVCSSRTAPDVYTHEMTDGQHQQLIELLLKIKGKAMVSMYHHEIYDVLSCKYGWELVEFNLPNNAAGGDDKRRMKECLWMNYRR
jgi:DNA adenine methylase